MKSRTQIPTNSFNTELPLSNYADLNATYDYKKALFKMAKKSLPLSISIFFVSCSFFVEQHFISNYSTDPDMLTGYNLANSYIMIVTIGLISSLNNGMIVRVSQAFGQENLNLCGHIFHKCLFINFFIALLLLLPIFLIKPVLSGLGSSTAACEYAHDYALYKMPAAFLIVIISTVSALFTGVKIIFFPSVIQAFSSIVGLALGYMFLNAGWGLSKFGLASSIGWNLCLLLFYLFIKFKIPSEGLFFKPSREAFMGLCSVFSFELTVGSITILDLLTMNITLIISGSFVSFENYGTIASENLSFMANTVAVAIGMLVSTYIGKALAEGNIAKAKAIIKAGTILGILLSNITLILCYVFREDLISFLTTDLETFDYGVSLVQWAVGLIPLNYIAASMTGAMRSIGREGEALAVVVLCDVVIFIPLSLLFSRAFDMNGNGFTVAGMISQNVKLMIFSYKLKKTVWERQIKIVKRELQKIEKD